MAHKWNLPSGQNISVVMAQVAGATLAILMRQGWEALGPSHLASLSPSVLDKHRVIMEPARQSS